MSRFNIRALFFPLLLILAGGCNRARNDQPIGPISVRDDLDRTVVLSQSPTRIVSLAPSVTETLFALGLDSAVVGVTEFCDFPEQAKTKQSVGGIMDPNIETIAALKPDLIILSVSGNSRSDLDKLTELGNTVFVTNPKTVEGIFKSISDLGTMTGRTMEAESLLFRLRSQRDSLLASIEAKPRPRVLLLLSLSPLIAAGPGSFLDELLNLAHASNAAANTPIAYPMLSREVLLRLQPDVLLATSDVAKEVRQIASSYPEWKSLNAVKLGRLAIVDANLVTRPGPRIVEGLRSLIVAIHEGRKTEIRGQKQRARPAGKELHS